jgi:hypothetical protein
MKGPSWAVVLKMLVMQRSSECVKASMQQIRKDSNASSAHHFVEQEWSNASKKRRRGSIIK